MHRTLIKDTDLSNWEELRLYRSCLNKPIFQAKCRYNNEQVIKNKKDPVKLWEIIKNKRSDLNIQY